jgi:hypothetical protein
MNRRFDRDMLLSSLAIRGRMLRALLPNSDKAFAAGADELRALVSELRAVAVKTAGLPEARALRLMSEALAICFYLSKWVAATRRAEVQADRFLSAAKARTASLQEALAEPLSFPQTQQGLSDWTSQVAAVSDVSAARDLLQGLAKVPLPVIYSIRHDPYPRSHRHRNSRTNENTTGLLSSPSPTPLVKLDFTLDGQALATPQAIGSGRQYGLRVRAQVNHCPVDQRVLELDCLTTMAASDYGICPFVLLMPGNDRHASVEGSGHLIIRASQSLLSLPASFKVRARFVNADRSAATPAVVIGYNELRLRALDQASFPILSRYPTVDIQIPKIVAEIRTSLPDLPPNDLDDFLNCLVCLGNYCGMVQQTGVFKGKKVDEKREFQQHLLQHMRGALGEDVREEETLVGGRLDLRYRRIIIELKIEDTTTDREVLRRKYTEQPTQYAAPSIPLGIVCILDMTEKVHPPSNIANNITLETPTVHGFENSPPTYPTNIAVVIIDANLKLPSDYSKAPTGMGKKKTPQPAKKPSIKKQNPP